MLWFLCHAWTVVAFQIQTKLVVVVAVAAFVAELRRQLGLGSITHHLDPRFTVEVPPKVKGIEKATTSPEIPEYCLI